MKPRPAKQRSGFTPAHQKPTGLCCDSCPLGTIGTGYVPATDALDRKLLFVGEAPGYDEARIGEPFVGMAGSMLRRVLDLIGLHREDAQFDNTIRCVPPNFEIARWPHAIQACEYLAGTLDQRAARHGRDSVIVTLGQTALQRVLGFPAKTKGVRVQDFHGTVQRDVSDRFWVVPTFHPSFLSRGATQLIGVVARDIQQAVTTLTAPPTPDPGQLWLDPPLAWFEAWATNYLAMATQDPFRYPLAVDIETPEKGADEGELVGTVENASYRIIRVNVSANPNEGITVPYEGGYIAILDRLLSHPAVKYFWYKGYDEPRLRAAGHVWHPLWSYDGMWGAKVLQAALPGGLGFWAPLYSTWGAWKHLSDTNPVKYAGIDALQTRRVCDGIFADLTAQGRFDVFARHLHRFHAQVLQPATDVGVPVNREKLIVFQGELAEKAAALLEAIDDAVPDSLCPLTPKAGLTRPPMEGAVHTKARATTTKGAPKKEAPDALKMTLYARATVVERVVQAVVQRCTTCGKVGVAKTHRCEKALIAGIPDPTPKIESAVCPVTRWFWREPFNPDSPPQLLAYAKAKGHQTGISKSTGNESMDRETLAKLIRETRDPVYAGVLDYRAINKVKGTYVDATLARLDGDDRLHGTFGFKPATMRLNGVNPNLQNVVADKGGKASLAAGFRNTIEARGRFVPAGSEYADLEPA
jgi:uracil-DNA glycosylase family 4